MAASSIPDNLTELDQLHDDLISERDREEEKRKEETDETNKRKARLVECGKALVAAASSKMKEKDDEDKNDRKSRKLKRDTVDSTDNVECSSVIWDQLKAKRKQDERFNHLRDQEPQHMRQRVEQDRLDREMRGTQTEKHLDIMAAIMNKINWMLDFWRYIL